MSTRASATAQPAANARNWPVCGGGTATCGRMWRSSSGPRRHLPAHQDVEGVRRTGPRRPSGPERVALNEHPGRTFAFDESGPPGIRPTAGSCWTNPLEAHFGLLRQFTLANSVRPNHTIQTKGSHRYLRWRDQNARLSTFWSPSGADARTCVARRDLLETPERRLSASGRALRRRIGCPGRGAGPRRPRPKARKDAAARPPDVPRTWSPRFVTAPAAPGSRTRG